MMFWLAIQPHKEIIVTQMDGKFPRDVEYWSENMLQMKMETLPNMMSPQAILIKHKTNSPQDQPWALTGKWRQVVPQSIQIIFKIDHLHVYVFICLFSVGICTCIHMYTCVCMCPTCRVIGWCLSPLRSTFVSLWDGQLTEPGGQHDWPSSPKLCFYLTAPS